MRELPFRLYPRGFLGAQLAAKIEKVAQPSNSDSTSLQNTIKMLSSRSSNELTGNPVIDHLYSVNIGGGSEVLTLEFRKKVLIAAFTAFGTIDFKTWFMIQNSTPYFGDLHRDFLDDTLRFISTGQREVAIQSWDSMLSYSDSGEVSKGITDYAKDFFHTYTSDNVNKFELVEVIQRWISQPNGIEDLLSTLHVLFGSN